MNYLQLTKNWLSTLSWQRKMSMFFCALIIIGITGFLSWLLLSPTYAVLFNHLDEQDANQIINKLEQDNTHYQLLHGGKDILIDKNLVAKTRLKIMAGGMHLNGSVGFELFDKSDFGMTDFSQKINYQRALQGELERTISSFEEVRQARVHLVIPENHLFEKEATRPKAAVTLYLKHELSPKQVRSIQHLVTASVAHLTIKNVVVVDHNGNTLSIEKEDNTSGQLTTKKTIELYLTDKVSQILYKIFPHNQIIVKVDAALNHDELQRELIKPQSQGQITHEKEIKHITSGKTEKDKSNEDTTLEKSYQFGSEKELFKRASGTIERLSISVVLPQDTSEQIITQVQRLVKNTIGFNESRGDKISIEALIAPNPQSIIPVIPLNYQPPAYRPDKTMLISYLILFLLSSAGGTLILKRIRQKKRQLLLAELTQWLGNHE